MRFRRIALDVRGELRSLSGVVEAAGEDEPWLRGAGGVTRIPVEELTTRSVNGGDKSHVGSSRITAPLHKTALGRWYTEPSLSTCAQTRSLIAVYAIAAAGVVGLQFLWCRRQVTNAVRARSDATLAERTRIAHELHDTLLQGLTGIALQLHSVQRTIATRPAVAAATLSRALECVDATLRDARNAVWDMRWSPELEEQTLPEALAGAARAAVGSAPIELRLHIRGEQWRLSRAVELVLEYEPRTLKLTVRDDGRGFTPADAESARNGGH